MTLEVECQGEEFTLSRKENARYFSMRKRDMKRTGVTIQAELSRTTLWALLRSFVAKNPGLDGKSVSQGFGAHVSRELRSMREQGTIRGEKRGVYWHYYPWADD